MLTPDLFEELLATYPAEKRDLARQIYYRFAEGDSTQFFTQLFIVLDIYAHYAGRVPEAVIEANQNAHANIARLREEIGLLAQTIEKRNVNITNQAEVTAGLCDKTVAQCRETIARFESALKNVGAQVDTKAIVADIQATLQTGIQQEVIAPFLNRSKELAAEVVPTLREIRENAVKASHLWPQRIWRTALWSSVVFTVALSVIATLVVEATLKKLNERKLAEQIARTTRVMNYNKDAFRQLAIAQVPIKVVRTSNTNGVLETQGFALLIENADATDMRRIEGRDTGLIFFTGHPPEKNHSCVAETNGAIIATAQGRGKLIHLFPPRCARTRPDSRAGSPPPVRLPLDPDGSARPIIRHRDLYFDPRPVQRGHLRWSDDS